MIDTLPRGLSPELLEFCSSISPERPKFVRSTPLQDAGPSACFLNVARRVLARGGGTAFGWAVWHVRGAYFEAEHHGIWRKPGGELLDVSPQLNGYRKILFLPDPKAFYDPGAFRPNVMKAESGSVLGEAFVATALRRYEILNAVRPPGIVEPIVPQLTAEDALEIAQLDARLRQLFAELGQSQ